MSQEAIVPPHTRAKIFLCYAHEDTEFAAQLVEALKARGLIVSWDQDLVPGPNYKSQLSVLVRTADVAVFVISPDSTTSTECADELRIASAQNKRILPVVCRGIENAETLPPYVRMPHWTRGDGGQTFAAIAEKIETAILTDFDLLVMHTWLQGQAESWEERGRVRSNLLRGANISTAEDFIARASADATKLPTPTQVEVQFVLSSRRLKRQVTRVATAVSFAVLAILAGLMIYATNSAKAAESAANERDRQAIRAQQEAAHAATAVAQRAEALNLEQAALGREKIATAQAKAEAVAKVAALDRERLALQQKAVAEENKRRADAKALAEAERAEAEAARTKAATVVSVGERFVDADPARAIAFGLAATKFSAENPADLLIRRAATQLPEHQIL
jgi:hypothetical protein